MRVGSFENRGGVLVSALVVALIVAAVSLMSAAEVFAQVILDPDFELEEIAYDPVTLTRTFKLSFPSTGVEDPFLTVELSGELREHARLDPRGLYLFHVNAAGLEEDLNHGVIPDALKEVFYAKGIAISERDSMVVLERDRRWRIAPSVIGQGNCMIDKKDGVLHVYQELPQIDDFVYQLYPAKMVIDVGALLAGISDEGGFVFDVVSFLGEEFTGSAGEITVSNRQDKRTQVSVGFTIPSGKAIFTGQVPDPPVEYSVPDEYCSCHAGRAKPDKWDRMLKGIYRAKAKALAVSGAFAAASPAVGLVTTPPDLYGPYAGFRNRGMTEADAAAGCFDAAIRYGKMARDPYEEEEIDFSQIVEDACTLRERLITQEGEWQRLRDEIADRFPWSPSYLENFYLVLSGGFEHYHSAIEAGDPLELAFSGLMEYLSTSGYYRDNLSQFIDAMHAALVEAGFGSFTGYTKFQQEMSELSQDLDQVQGDIVSTYIVLDFNRDVSILDDSIPGASEERKIYVLLNYHESGSTVYFDEFETLDPTRREHYLVGIIEIEDELPSRVVLEVEDLSLLRADENIIYTIGQGVDAEFAVRKIRLIQNLKGVQIPVVASSQEEADRLAGELLVRNCPEGARMLPAVPDLTVYPEDLKLSLDEAEPYLEITVRNFGMEDAVEVPVQIWGYKSGEEAALLAQETISSVSFMGSRTIKLSLIALEGMGEIVVRVNPSRKIEELDYTNNEAKISPSMAGAVAGIAIDPSELKIAPEQEFSVDLFLPVKDVQMMGVYLNFDPSYLKVEKFEPNEQDYLFFMSGIVPLDAQDQDTYFDNGKGYVDFNGDVFMENVPPDLTLIKLATITFKAKSIPLTSLPIQTSLDFNLEDPRRTLLFSSEGEEPEISPGNCQIQILLSGIVEGKVKLQGRQDHAGAVVYLNGEERATTNFEGYFKISGLEEKSHLIEIKKVGFLSAGRGDVEVTAGNISRLPEVTMLAGDCVPDDVVDDKDLSYIVEHYDSFEPSADINGDGVVDPSDLEWAEINYGKRARSPWYGQVMITPLERVTDVEEEKRVETLPKEFSLSQNFPNPFNPATEIGVQLPESSDVRIVIYNLLGQEVRRLVDGFVEAGTRSVVWDGRDGSGREVGSGMYLIRMTAGDFVGVRKMALIR